MASTALPRSESLLRIGTRSAKIDGSIETKKYRGERLVSSAARPAFRAAMIHATITGLEKDKPAHEKK